jgi:hypothetical protein
MMHRSNLFSKLLLILACGLLTACILLSSSPVQQSIPTQTPRACPTLPATFKENDLIGTWRASYALEDQDTLIIKEDGTYKQIYESQGDILVETEWLKWWLEKRESGYMRLHLENMRRCDDLRSICNREGGGLDSKEYTAIDMCEGSVIEMPHEVVLIVTGANYETPRGIILRHTRIAGSDWYWAFEFVEK